MSNRSDAELLEEWRGGAGRAGEALLERYRERLTRFFTRRLPQGGSDLVQQTLVACIESKDRLVDARRFRPFLFAIAHNLLRAHLRGQRRHPEAELDEETAWEDAPGPMHAAMQRRDAERLLEALRRLSPQEQALMALRYWERRKGHEIGVALGVPEGTVRSRLGRAHARLRAELARPAARGEASVRSADFERWATATLDGSRRRRAEPAWPAGCNS